MVNPSIPGAIPIVVSSEPVQAYSPPMPEQNPNAAYPPYVATENPSGMPPGYAPAVYQQYIPNNPTMLENGQPQQYIELLYNYK